MDDLATILLEKGLMEEKNLREKKAKEEEKPKIDTRKLFPNMTMEGESDDEEDNFEINESWSDESEDESEDEELEQRFTLPGTFKSLEEEKEQIIEEEKEPKREPKKEPIVKEKSEENLEKPNEFSVESINLKQKNDTNIEETVNNNQQLISPLHNTSIHSEDDISSMEKKAKSNMDTLFLQTHKKRKLKNQKSYRGKEKKNIWAKTQRTLYSFESKEDEKRKKEINSIGNSIKLSEYEFAKLIKDLRPRERQKFIEEYNRIEEIDEKKPVAIKLKKKTISKVVTRLHKNKKRPLSSKKRKKQRKGRKNFDTIVSEINQKRKKACVFKPKINPYSVKMLKKKKRKHLSKRINEEMAKKEKYIKEHKAKQKNEEKKQMNYSFKPKINRKSERLDNRGIGILEAWKTKRELRKIQKLQAKGEKEAEKCTFKPEISQKSKQIFRKKKRKTNFGTSTSVFDRNYEISNLRKQRLEKIRMMEDIEAKSKANQKFRKKKKKNGYGTTFNINRRSTKKNRTFKRSNSEVSEISAMLYDDGEYYNDSFYQTKKNRKKRQKILKNNFMQLNQLNVPQGLLESMNEMSAHYSKLIDSKKNSPDSLYEEGFGYDEEYY